MLAAFPQIREALRNLSERQKAQLERQKHPGPNQENQHGRPPKHIAYDLQKVNQSLHCPNP